MPISISILGLGKMGENHLRVLSLMKDVEIKFIYDQDKKRLNELSKSYNVNSTQSLEEAVSNCDAIYISTPTNTHLSFLRSAPIKLKIFFLKNHQRQIYQIQLSSRSYQLKTITLFSVDS